MVSQKAGKILLCIAGALAIVQSVVNFAGGIFAANDRNVKAYSGWLNSYVGDYKYYCGFMSISSPPANVAAEGAECVHKDYDMDDGWFESAHNNCNRRHYEYDFHACELNGWGHVIAFAAFTGAGWMTAGVLCIASAIRVNKRGAMVALVILGIVYIVAIAIFGFVWSSVSKVNKYCLKLTCKQVKEHGQKSSNRFLVYAVASFASILVAGILSFIGYRSFEALRSSDVSDSSPHLPSSAQAPVLYPAPLPGPSDGIPYGVPVNAQPVFVSTQVVGVGGHGVICQGVVQSHSDAGKERAASGVGKSSEEILASSEGTPVIRKQTKDTIAALKDFIKAPKIPETNESISGNTPRGRKSVLGELISQSLNFPAIKKLLGMAGLMREIDRKDSVVRQSGDTAQKTKEQN